MPPRVGSPIEARCGKCRAATKHVVVSMEKGRPKQVRCKKCGSSHGYAAPANPPAAAKATSPKAKAGGGKAVGSAAPKGAPPPKGAAAVKGAAASKGGAVTKAAAPSKKTPHEPPLSDYERALKGSEERPLEKYKMSGLYTEGARLQHTTFGVGVVSRIVGPHIIEVIFKVGTRRLAIGR